MKILQYPSAEGLSGSRIVAIGLFDGVHLAHRELLARAKAQAIAQDLPLCVFTFDGKSLKPSAPRLYGLSDRLSLLEETGADEVIVADFASLSGLSAEAFVEKTLLSDLKIAGAAVGFNFRFGKGACADAQTLRRLLREAGVVTDIGAPYLFDGTPLSSTSIRGMIAEGDVARAADALGKPYFLSGTVEHGDGRGKTLGVPTVNLPFAADGVLPKFGVYASALLTEGKIYPAVTNVGCCPTFGARTPHSETTVFSEVGDLWGKDVKVYLLQYLREERTFESQEALLSQIQNDEKRAKAYIGESKWQEIGRN